ncbi:hypothetical protein [Streptomyces sp. ISL-43]|uniref:hypothetical protein n=1 Tax=Streptomyces sp. ISL-43 TaxID=2819183 RepID=UPI0035A86EDA
MYGHSELYTGRFTLIDGTEIDESTGRKRLIVNEPLMKQAREVLPAGALTG